MKKCTIFGLGYIGLPTAIMLAKKGVNVLGVDVQERVINSINNAQLHIVEPGLDLWLKESVENGSLKASARPEEADVFVIAVPTPFMEGCKPDLSFIRAAAEKLAPVLKKDSLVILESTSPVGTTESLADWLAEMRPDLTFPQQAGEKADVQLAYCPERVLPGKISSELVENARIIGGMTKKASKMAADFYKTFVKGEMAFTNARTAEMCKLTENSYRDLNIAFANELSILCDKMGIDVWELIELANKHPRVNILQPGCGVGGHCIAVDPWFIVHSCPDEARLIAAARKVNDHKALWVAKKIKNAVLELALKRKIESSRISLACLGLSFKADIDDLRESPALKITAELADSLDCRILAVEPHIRNLPNSLAMRDVEKVSLTKALEADIIALLVPHSSFNAWELPSVTNALILDYTGFLKQQKQR